MKKNKKRILKIAQIITWILGFLAIGLLIWQIIKLLIS